MACATARDVSLPMTFQVTSDFSSLNWERTSINSLS